MLEWEKGDEIHSRWKSQPFIIFLFSKDESTCFKRYGIAVKEGGGEGGY